MLQIWNIKSRAHECARTAQPFTEGEIFHTAIYFDTEAGELIRRDVSISAWKEEIAERVPIAYWRTEYAKPQPTSTKPEIATRESPEGLLRRLIEDDQEHTEHARYILALMLERKRQLVPKEKKYTESGTMLIYEMRRTGEVFIIRDPELRLNEIEAVQEEVAMLLGFGGPDAEPAPSRKPAPEPPAAETPPAEEPGAEPEVATAETEGASEPEAEAPAEPETAEEPDSATEETEALATDADAAIEEDGVAAESEAEAVEELPEDADETEAASESEATPEETENSSESEGEAEPEADTESAEAEAEKPPGQEAAV